MKKSFFSKFNIMNIIVKTVGNKKFPLVDVAEDSTVAALKDRIANELDFGGEIKKLIFKGKSLKDGNTLSSCGIESDSEIVCLVKKSRGKKAKTPEKKEAKATSSAPENREYTIDVEHVKQLMGMGFPQHMVVLSLKAAFGDPTVASQYLIAGGIPSHRAAELQKDMEDYKAHLAKQAYLAQQAQGGASAPSAKPKLGPQGMNADFEAMRGNPEQMQAIMSNKLVQQQCLQMMAQEKPELFKRFAADPDKVGEEEEFMKTMFHILRKSFSAQPQRQKPKVIELSREDSLNIKQLMEQKRVSRKQAITIYLKNGKNLEASMKFCDQLMEKAIADAEASGALDPQTLAQLRDLRARAKETNTDLLSAAASIEQREEERLRRTDTPALPQRRALSPRNSNIQHPEGAQADKASTPTAASPEDAVLSIPLDMLMEDEE